MTTHNPGRNGRETGRLSRIAGLLAKGSAKEFEYIHERAVRRKTPSREVITRIIEMLRAVLFPGYFGPKDLTDETLEFHVGATLGLIEQMLADQVARGLAFQSEAVSGMEDVPGRFDAETISRRFIQTLPEIQRLLNLDVQAAYEGDPAATSPGETVFCYPGIFALTNFRIAHELHLLNVPLIPRIITELAHGATGIDIHPGARIGERFFIDHGTGVVIGETCVIGSGVRIYQGVTLGAKSFPLDADGNPIKGIPRHPIVEDDVIIYSGATILGRITIGKGSVIGGNVWLTRDVPPGSRIAQRQPRLSGFNEV